MGTVFKVLLFFIIIYFLYSWFSNLISPNKRKSGNNRDVRIFKKGDIEKSKLDVQDAETVDFEEIEDIEESRTKSNSDFI